MYSVFFIPPSSGFSGNSKKIQTNENHLPPPHRFFKNSDILDGEAREVIISENLIAYIATSKGGLVIINVSKSDCPKIIGEYDDDGYTEGLYLHNSLVYLVDDGLKIIDISDPTNPNLISHYKNQINDVFIKENKAYLAAGKEGFLIIDISIPSNPVLIGKYISSGNPNSVYRKRIQFIFNPIK